MKKQNKVLRVSDPIFSIVQSYAHRKNLGLYEAADDLIRRADARLSAIRRDEDKKAARRAEARTRKAAQ